MERLAVRLSHDNNLDATTLHELRTAARVLRELDERIETLTVALRKHGGREAREYLRHPKHQTFPTLNEEPAK